VWTDQWLRLALSKGPNRVGVSLSSPKDGNRPSFRNAVFSSIYISGRVPQGRLQSHLDPLETWIKRWQININETKSLQVTFSLKKGKCPAVYLNNTALSQSSTVKYLGFHLDSRLKWKQHIEKKKKRKQIDLKVKDLYWIIGHKSTMSLDSKVLLHKTIIKPIWIYGIELWSCASKSSITIKQRSPSKILRMITNAPWYVTNETLHEDLNVPYITEFIRKRSIKHLNIMTK
jgi:hypothetical protein